MNIRIHIALMLLLISNVSAQECYQGQYIFELSSVAAKQDREIAEADKLLPEKIYVTEESKNIALVEDGTAEWDAEEGELETESAAEGNDLCVRLKKKIREAKLSARNSGKIIRLPSSCVCNEKISVEATPNDPLYGNLWGIGQAGNFDSNASEAWDIHTGTSETIVAIVDTGVDYTHPDLAQNMWRNTGEIPGNGIDDDNNGYKDDVYGINSIYSPSDPRAGDPMDDHYHGTHVAGTIGAVGNNGTGVVGVNWSVKMIAVKFLAANGSGSLYDAIESTNYISDLKERKGVNVKVVNNSWGGGGYVSAMETAIRRMDQLGIAFVAAAGNNTNNNDSNPSYPAGYNVPNVVSVAAHDSYGNLANFSNYGANTVHISAPGVGISSTVRNGGYSVLSGTSMASPHVAGALTLLASYRPNLSARTLIDTVLNNAVPMNSLSGKVQGSRALNVYNALLNAPTSNPPGQTPTTPIPTPTFTPTPMPTNTPTPAPTIAPYASLQGKVTDGSGRGIASAVVHLLNNSTNIEQVVVTGPDGSYSFANKATNIQYTLSVTLSGFTFQPAVYNVNLRTDVTINFFAAQQSYPLIVQVLTRTKRALSGIGISFGSYGSGTTNSDGLVVVSIPYGESYQASVVDEDIPLLNKTLHGEIFGETRRTLVTLDQ